MIFNEKSESNILSIVSVLTVLFFALALFACEKNQSNDIDAKNIDNSTRITIPRAITEAKIDQSEYKAWITITDRDGVNVDARKEMRVDNGVVSFSKTNLTPGEYTFTVTFEFSQPDQPAVTLAQSNVTVSIGAGENTLSFSESDFEFPDDDNDKVSNLNEIVAKTDPGKNQCALGASFLGSCATYSK